MPKKPQPDKMPKPYIEDGNIEAHIIADMLRIESITAELREFKDTTKTRLDKLESWIVAIVGLTFTTLVTTVVGLLMKVL
tara:strand:- start:1178 stop:1417 length:240 start_codon:yes stop_codon:yes gene_type:complete